MSKKLIEVDAQAFDDLMYWLDRCAEKGHLENCGDLVEPWAAFDASGWRVAEAARAAAEPIYQLRCTVFVNEWRDATKEEYDAAEGLVEYDRREFLAAPPAVAHEGDPEQWSDQQVRNFLATALRHVDVKGTLHCQDIRDGFRVMREQAVIRASGDERP